MILATHRSGARLAATIVLVAAVSACQAPTPSGTPLATTPPTPRPSPTAIPTPPLSPAPSPSEGGASPELLVRVTRCTEICIPTPGTTVLADGRIIWTVPGDGEQPARAIEAKLTASAMRRVREELAGRPELATDGEYLAVLRPGAVPLPRGTTVYRFEVGAADPHVVFSGEPADFAAEPGLWILSESMVRLARLASRLLDPLAWLGSEAVSEPARPFGPARYLVLIELFPGIGESPEFGVDVDDVASPLGGPLDGVGAPLAQTDETFPIRCLVTDADTAARLAAAEREAGAIRDVALWSSAVGYAWTRGQGFVQVTLTQVLPHQADPCAELERQLAEDG